MIANQTSSSTQSRMRRISTASRIAWIVCLLLMAVGVGNALLDLLNHGWHIPGWPQDPALSTDLQEKVLRFERFNYFLGLAGMLAFYGLFAALFRAFERGRIFSSEAVRILRYLGCSYFAYYFLCLVAPVLCGLPMPSAQLRYYWAQVGPLLAGLGIVLASWILEEGKRIQDDQALTI